MLHRQRILFSLDGWGTFLMFGCGFWSSGTYRLRWSSWPSAPLVIPRSDWSAGRVLLLSSSGIVWSHFRMLFWLQIAEMLFYNFPDECAEASVYWDLHLSADLNLEFGSESEGPLTSVRRPVSEVQLRCFSKRELASSWLRRMPWFWSNVGVSGAPSLDGCGLDGAAVRSIITALYQSSTDVSSIVSSQWLISSSSLFLPSDDFNCCHYQQN